MKTSKIALIVYVSSSILAVIADFIKENSLLLLAVAFIIPSLAFYYIVECKKISFLLCGILAANFIGDSLGLMDFDNEINYLVIPFFISNILLVLLMLQNLEKFKFRILNLISLMILGIFLGFLWYAVVDLFAFENDLIRTAIKVFGVSLFFLAFFASYNVIWRVSIPNLFLMIGATCIMISDIFYVLFNFQNQLFLIDTIHFTAQMFSYYFIVKYVLMKELKTNNTFI